MYIFFYSKPDKFVDCRRTTWWPCENVLQLLFWRR